MRRQKKYFIFTIILILAVVTTIIVIQNRYIPESKAEEKTGKAIKITFSSGSKTGAFDNVTKTLKANINSGYVTLPENFQDTISMNAESYFSKVDDETYYFTEGDYSYTFTGWKIKGSILYTPMETVFQPGDVVNYDTLDINKDGTVELEAVWGKVIYAQNEYTGRYYTDYWIYDKEYTEANYKATEAWNYKYENSILTLNKGKNVDEPICSLDYAYFLLYNDSNNEDMNNAYLNVLMLTGNLDYVKGNTNSSNQANFFTQYKTYIDNNLIKAGFIEDENNYTKTDLLYNVEEHYIWGEYTAQTSAWGYVSKVYYGSDRNNKAPCFTFKSLSAKNYAIDWNSYNYSDVMIGNIRFDSAMFRIISSSGKRPLVISPSQNATETSFYGGQYNYVEFTSRAVVYSNSVSVLRPGGIQNVVVNGGKFGSWQTSWSSSLSSMQYDINWYMGKNTICGNINLGTTSNSNMQVSINITIKLTITGGTINGNIYGGSRGIANNDLQNRIINIIGDKTDNIKSNPKITGNIFGAGDQGTLTGNTYINIKGSTKISGNIYGGGYTFTATLYGNANINIENSIIQSSVFAGGYNGNIDVDSNGNGGNTNLKINLSQINGEIFGVGKGGTQSITIEYRNGASNSQYNWKTTKFLPEDSFFTSGRESFYKDYDTDWSWNKPSTGFPFLITDKTSAYYGYVCAYTTKEIYWTSNNKENIDFKHFRTFYYLSLAYVKKDVKIEIDNSTIGTATNGKGNIYGGGSIAVVYGDVDININNTTIYGDIYGGGDGTSQPQNVTLYKPQSEENYVAPSYKVDEKTGNVTTQVESVNSLEKFGEFKWSNDQSILENGGIDYTNKLIYSPNTEGLGSVKGNVTLNVNKSSIKGKIYGGGNAGNVAGNTELNVEEANVGSNLYTGGNSGSVDGYTKLTINSGTYGTVFGGGYSGKVLGNSTVEIIKGTYANIFGGGDQSYIQGSTNVTVGQENSNESLIVTGLVYGGGRGYDANGDGDASDFTTVYGSSEVLIQGINTKVENYGSIKLGAVAGNVDVNFKNYWSGNSTAKYKTMNGIDRATTVSFDNSYVLLENKDTSGNLEGIQAIENLVIPSGSGLKISANGEITGNYDGGGELYLDSLVCLTVQGNITGKTTLVLNPKLMENGTQGIRGGIKVPYLKVGGTAPEEIALVSGENNKYVIMQANKKTVQEEVGENYIYYYIANDVTIENNITIETNSIENRKYKEEVTNTEEVKILDKGIFTTENKISYYLTNDAYNKKDYTKITRKLKMISNTEVDKEVIIPKGTEVTMIENGEYYYYIVESENITEISLSEFKKSSNNSKYNELKDITNTDIVEKTTNEVTGTTSYLFKENYKFIFNFENTKGIKVDRYYPSLEVYYGETTFGNEKKDVANNIVDIQKREYTINLTKDRDYYENNSLIKLEGNLEIGSLKENTYLKSQNLYLKLELKDTDNNVVKIPEGTKVTINNSNYEVKKGHVIVNILNNLGTASVNKKLDIRIDMTGVLKQDRISKGEYKISVEYLNEREYEEIVEQEISVIEKQEGSYGIKAVVNAQEGVEDEELQIIKNEEETTRNIKIEYENASELKNMKIKIKAIERTGEFEYQETTNSKNKITLEKTEININETNEGEQDIKVTFQKGISKGTYRIKVELRDEYDNIKTMDYVNFIVD